MQQSAPKDIFGSTCGMNDALICIGKKQNSATIGLLRIKRTWHAYCGYTFGKR